MQRTKLTFMLAIIVTVIETDFAITIVPIFVQVIRSDAAIEQSIIVSIFMYLHISHVSKFVCSASSLIYTVQTLKVLFYILNLAKRVDLHSLPRGPQKRVLLRLLLWMH